jgi:hypothetical protein
MSNFRHVLAVRGLGMLSGFSMDSKRVTVTVETSCVPLFMVGGIKGLFELETGNEKTTLGIAPKTATSASR